jgi:hypothetical protein
MVELSGIQRGTGAKVKADIQNEQVVFRGAIKATVPFAAIGAEARGTLLCLTFGEHIVDLAAGAKAASFAAKMRRAGA